MLEREQAAPIARVGEERPSLPVRCRVIATDSELDALALQWNGLFLYCTHPTPFCSWIWIRTWWRHYRAHLAPGSFSLRLHIICITDADGLLIGIAPLYAAVPVRAPLHMASLRPMGSRIAGTQEDLTEEPVLLMRAGHEREALRALAAHLNERRCSPDQDYFVFRCYERLLDLPVATFEATALQRYFLLKRETQPGQTVALAKTWEAFRSGLSKSMRDNVKYYPRLLTRRGHACEIETVTEPGAVRGAAHRLVDLHRRRANSKRGIAHTNHLPADLQAEFLIDALSGLAEQGMASLHCLRVNRETVAVLAVLRHAQIITIYYSGFDPAWYDYSPITILTTEALRQAIARGDTTANFLPGAFPWKERWGAVSDRTMVQYTYLRRHPRALLRAAVEAGRRALNLAPNQTREP